MSGKRVATSSINWTAFAERVPKSDMANFNALKSRNDNYIRRVAAQPASLPKIDWNYYKSKITIPGLVDSFQKSYDSLNIPYPSDQGLIAQIDEQEKSMKKSFAEYVAEVDEHSAQLKAELTELESQLPYSEMTVEEFFLARPDLAIDPVNNPTLFPHGPEEREYTRQLKESGKL